MAAPLQAATFPHAPSSRIVVLDEAEMIDGEDFMEVREIIESTLDETAIPIVVVTIVALAEYDAGHWPIERYARELFDHWGIGHKTVQVAGEQVSRNLGILLLVSEEDRKARIELGADWGHTKDALCARIMQEHIVASFKRGDFSTGIHAGVEALSAMAREVEIPSPPRPMWHYLAVAAAVGLAIFTAVSLVRRGASGWAWLFWGLVFSIVGFILYMALRSRGGSGGFGGGSFGGGFSGGGGATGSW